MKPLACREMPARLSLLLDGRLTADEASAAQSHLRQCHACRREHEALLALRVTLAALPTPEPRADALPRLRAALTGAPLAGPVRVLGVAAAGLLLLAVYLARVDRPTPVNTARVGQATSPADGRRATAGTVPSRPELRKGRKGDCPLLAVASPPASLQPASHRPGPVKTSRSSRTCPRAEAPSPTGAPHGSLIVVVFEAEAPPGEPPPVSPDPAPVALASIEPGTTSYFGEIAPQDDAPGSQLMVSRTIGDDLLVEKIEIAYQPLPPTCPDPAPRLDEDEEESSHVPPPCSPPSADRSLGLYAGSGPAPRGAA